MNHGGESVRPEVVQQAMGALSINGHCVLPSSRTREKRRLSAD